VKHAFDLISLALQGAFAPSTDGQLPVRIKVLNWGVNQTKKGDVIVNETTLRELPLNQIATGFDVISLDFEHNTVPGTKAHAESPEPRKIAAQLKPEVIAGEGVYVTVLNWTPDGKAAAQNFVDVSAAPAINANREVVFLHSVALTRVGATEGMHFLTLSVEIETKPKTEEPAMDEKKLMELIALAIADALKPLQERLTVIEAAGTAAKTCIETLSVESTAAKTRLAEIAAADVKRTREEIVREAMRAGKVLPLSAEDLKSIDIELLRKIAAQTPATVPVQQITPLSVADPAAGVPAAVSMVARVCGMDPKKIIEANAPKA
jgi:hypothetical protein